MQTDPQSETAQSGAAQQGMFIEIHTNSREEAARVLAAQTEYEIARITVQKTPSGYHCTLGSGVEP